MARSGTRWLVPHNFAVTLKRKVRGWPGEMLLLPSAEAQ
jgi:hypothetical protein